ncbi:MAG: lysophospholipid acyltransferase family protein [Bacteroidota bacterium]
MNIINRLFYYGFILPISRLPFSALYFFSDVLYILFYYVARYRKKVIRGNIRRSFPDKTEQEWIPIEKEFYRHFCDLILESLKVFTISAKQVHQRMKIRNPELANQFFNEGRSIIIAGGHYNNWELFAVAIDEAIKHQAKGIYKPLSNKYFDRKMQATRSKYGLELVHHRKVKESFEADKDKPTATIFAIDQSPTQHAPPLWMNFLNQETAVLTGTEKYARRYNYPVVFGRIHKIKRGHYEFEMELVCENPAGTEEGEVTIMTTRMLERDIQQVPAYWLWSHRRWKHKRSVEVVS